MEAMRGSTQCHVYNDRVNWRVDATIEGTTTHKEEYYILDPDEILSCLHT